MASLGKQIAGGSNPLAGMCAALGGCAGAYLSSCSIHLAGMCAVMSRWVHLKEYMHISGCSYHLAGMCVCVRRAERVHLSGSLNTWQACAPWQVYTFDYPKIGLTQGFPVR